MVAPKVAFHAAIARCPLVAILRGVRSDEVEKIGGALVDAGFSMIEVPLNSPNAITSIERLVKRFGDEALIGAGTVLTPAQVSAVAAAGGRMTVSPNSDPAVIRKAAAMKMVSLPGYSTPTEAFAALAAGASGVKLFPAEATHPAALKAQRAVIPSNAIVFVVGGITSANMEPWRSAGADGFGLGSALYKPGFTAQDVSARANAFVRSVEEMHTQTNI